jgi:hypothetical protein
MNEPHYGFIGYRDLSKAEAAMVPMGPLPSPWDCIQAASGRPVEVPVHSLAPGGRKISRYETFNPQGLSLFKEGFSCPWKQAGVWAGEGSDARLLKADHFAMYENKPVDFMRDFHKPFLFRFIERMKEADEKTLFFIEGLPQGAHPVWEKNDPPNVINAFHWYDGFALFTKSFRPWFTIRTDTAQIVLGRKKTADWFRHCLAEGVNWTRDRMENMPCLLGEFGLAFDMNKRKAFSSGDYSVHEDALSMY